MDEDLKDLVMRTMKEGRQYDSDLVDAIEKLVPSSKPVDLTDRVELSMVALRLAMALAVTKGLFNQIVDNCNSLITDAPDVSPLMRSYYEQFSTLGTVDTTLQMEEFTN